MARIESSLALAGVAAGVALVLAGAGLTIGIIAAARPPVSEYLTAAQNAQEAIRVRWQLMPTVLSLTMALWMGGRVVLRRPLFQFQWGKTERRRLPSAKIVVGLLCVLLALQLWSVSLAISAVRAAGSRPITDSMAFGGIGAGLGSASLVCEIAAHLLFLQWWSGKRFASAPGAGARALQV